MSENENIHLSKEKNKMNFNNNCCLKYINSLKTHIQDINKILNFPSGNLISVSDDKSIIIYNINFTILQIIEKAHDNSINYVDIKDENNFVTCSYKNIKTWIKIKNKFQMNKIIEKAHNDWINQVIYYSNIYLISCSNDKKIKIWEENNNNFQNISILENSYYIYSVLLLEDKNIMISSGLEGTKFWNLNNFELIKFLRDTLCSCWNSLCRIDENKIIINNKYNQTLKIISISEKKIIKEINNQFFCQGIFLIKNKGIFLVGGDTQEIKIYRNDNYECIQTIKDIHENIIGFNEIKNGKIISYGYNGMMMIWSF